MTQYFVVFHNEFEESKSFTAIVGSITYGTYYSAAPLASFLIQRYDIRWTTILGAILSTSCYILNAFATSIFYLILTHGLLLGIGLCLISNASIISLGMYFKRYAHVVTGISLAGTGVGVFIFAVFIPYLLDKYGWRGSMFIMAAVTLQSCITGSVLFSLKLPNRCKNETEMELFDNPKSEIIREQAEKSTDSKSLLTSSRFWCLNISQFFFCMSIISLVILYKDFALTKNLGDYFAWNVAAFGIGDIGGRLLSGLLVSIPNCSSAITLFGVAVSVAIMVMVTCFMEVTIGFITCSLLLGIGIGAQVALYFILPSDVFGREKYVVVLGYVQTTAGIGSLIGPPIAGVITDFDPSYKWTLGFISILQLVSSLLVFIVYYLHSKRIKTRDGILAVLDNEDIKIGNVLMNPRAALVKRSAQGIGGADM
uniref:Major facilitator superfamily (MFS) profile domain-containing protein n=1 Tax=Strigamia maritima TaxID=126957 RepID=T1J4N9_STRMM